jgi:hypothetical protein
MKYSLQKLDGRHSYHRFFQYYIGFSNSMSNNKGPECFSCAQRWFFQTYGWSAEIRQWNDIHRWYNKSVPFMTGRPIAWATPTPDNLPDECNPSWSWTNAYNNLRIYVATPRELAFFQLAFPVDQ